MHTLIYLYITLKVLYIAFSSLSPALALSTHSFDPSLSTRFANVFYLPFFHVRYKSYDYHMLNAEIFYSLYFVCVCVNWMSERTNECTVCPSVRGSINSTKCFCHASSALFSSVSSSSSSYFFLNGRITFAISIIVAFGRVFVFVCTCDVAWKCNHITIVCRFPLSIAVIASKQTQFK